MITRPVTRFSIDDSLREELPVRSNRALLCSITAVALLLSCSASGAREGAAPPPKSNAAPANLKYREGLSGVDFTGLDATGKERALKIMNEQMCDCGCGMTIAQCRVEDKTCPRSPGLAATVVAGVKASKSDAEIVAALKQNTRPAAPAAPAAPPVPTGPVQISTDGAYVKGKPSAKATLVEYADFQCPYCVRAVPIVQQVLQKYPDDVKYIFKQLPLVSIHKFAEPAARANVAAGLQGKYWEMHDVLFQNARALDNASLRKYAQDLGLDMARFDKDFSDPAVKQAIDKDVAESQRIGVTGTPTFFVNGYQVPSLDIDTLSKMIEAAKTGGDVGASVAEIRQRQADQEAAYRKQIADQQAADASRVHDIDVTGSPVRGDSKAAVTIVEFSDFQCPYCASSGPLLKQVLDAYPGKVRLIYKHLPLVSIHPNARPAALAAAEALQQGKFWEMHDKLFQNYSQLTRENLSNIAMQVGLDMDKFEKAMQTEAHKATVDKDMAESQRIGVRGTPSFFVNGRKVMSRDFDTFKRMIEEALKSGKPSAG
jgi:protein-disulfide isomerase